MTHSHGRASRNHGRKLFRAAASRAFALGVLCLVVGSISSGVEWRSGATSPPETIGNWNQPSTGEAHGANKAAAEEGVIHLELRPTSSLVEERRRERRRRERRRRRLSQRSNIPLRPEEISDFPEEWFHPQSRAVYATLHPPHEYDHDDDDDTLAADRHHYRDFVAHRHLSRFERSFRERLGLDLHPHWGGNYSSQPLLELHDPAVLIASILDDPANDPISSHDSSSNSSKNYAYGLRRHGHNQQTANSTMHSTLRKVPRRRRRHLLESLVGGKLDRYQGIPLSQGYGTHYVHLWVGSPVPQRQSVIVDTGSHFTGFPVARECQNCGERHHTDPPFDPERSETFHALSCPAECVENYRCETAPEPLATNSSTQAQHHHIFAQQQPPQRCAFTQAYTEGSSWTAYQARDRVYCGGGADLLEAVDPLDVRYSIDFVFGCLRANTGLFVTQLADGIMGMSAHEMTLPKQLYNQQKIEHNLFAMCFRRELGTSKRGVTAGSMTLGGVSSALDTSPMVYARNIRPYGWYTVFIEKIYLATKGGTKFLFDDPVQSIEAIQHEHSIVTLSAFDPTKVNRDRGVIVDSGTTDTYLSSIVREEFTRIWKEATGTEYTNSAVYLTQAQLQKLPTLLVQLQAPGTTGVGGNDSGRKPVLGQVGYLDPEHQTDVLLAIPATSYMEYTPTLKLYTSRLFFTESRGGVIGANSMQGHNVVFDWQHGRIGFAQSSCRYDLIAGKNDNHGDFGGGGRGGSSAETGTEEDPCVFVDHGKLPILTQTCLQSVSSNPSGLAICQASDSPTNVEIEGVEIWTQRIRYPGSDPSRCRASISEWSESLDTHHQIEASTTRCTPDGLCQEDRPCHVPCLDVLAYHKQKGKKKKHHHHHNVPNSSSTLLLDEAVTIPHPVVNRTGSVIGESENEYGDPASVVSLCQNSLWTACDHSCHQSRIHSAGMVTHSNGRYCLESSRETRSCHIDACGRNDPCIVPYLVHAIFILESNDDEDETIHTPSEPPPYWTPRVEEDFRTSLVAAAHHPDVNNEGKYTPLFGEGDVDILVARPWFGDEEEIGSNDLDETADAKLDEGKESRGVQLILQISISNPKAIPKEQQSPPTGQRKLLQEVGVVWSNFTSVFRAPRSTSVCDPFDLYPLARTANVLADNVLGSPRFLSLLVASEDGIDVNVVDNAEGGGNARISNHRLHLDGIKGFRSAKLVSSWTIGTQIYDDSVNYLGPLVSTPLFPIIKFLHEAFYFILALWLCKLLICLSKSARLCRVWAIKIRKKWYRKNDNHERNGAEEIDSSLSLLPSHSTGGGSSLEIELSTTYLGSKATKRTNSTVTSSTTTAEGRGGARMEFSIGRNAS